MLLVELLQLAVGLVGSCLRLGRRLYLAPPLLHPLLLPQLLLDALLLLQTFVKRLPATNAVAQAAEVVSLSAAGVPEACWQLHVLASAAGWRQHQACQLAQPRAAPLST